MLMMVLANDGAGKPWGKVTQAHNPSPRNYTCASLKSEVQRPAGDAYSGGPPRGVQPARRAVMACVTRSWGNKIPEGKPSGPVCMAYNIPGAPLSLGQSLQCTADAQQSQPHNMCEPSHFKDLVNCKTASSSHGHANLFETNITVVFVGHIMLQRCLSKHSLRGGKIQM
jgi:hypothetical protein